MTFWAEYHGGFKGFSPNEFFEWEDSHPLCSNALSPSGSIMITITITITITIDLINYAPKGDGKRTRGRHSMREWQDNVVIIVVVIWLLPTSSVRSAYDSRRPVDSLSPASSLAEAKYRTGCCTMT